MPVTVTTAAAGAILRNGVELGQSGLRAEAHESGLTRKHVDGIPDRAIGRMRHHRVGAGASNPHVLVRLRRRAGLGVVVDLAIAIGVENPWRPALRLHGIAGLVPYPRVDPASHRTASGAPQRAAGVIAE